MTLRIADSFTDSLARLSGPEQAAAKQAAFDLQVNPANPGLSFHRVDRARDRNFWTVRASSDIRLVVHKRGGDLLLAYVGHHDAAYRWAERRRLEVHPRTGAAQLVEIRERVEEIVIHQSVTAPEPGVLANESDDALLDCGVPPDWLDDVRAASEDTLLDLAGHLPAEAAEAVLNLATGIRPAPPAPAEDPFEHPDAQRRFRLLEDSDELARALDASWEKWTVFLHPAQREFVERDFNGPARVIGSAGTGKTVVALHRAVRLVRENPHATVLLTTFNEALARALRTKLSRLVGDDTALAGRIVIRDLASIGVELYAGVGDEEAANRAQIRAALNAAAEAANDPIDRRFLEDEWHLVVDGWGVQDEAAYLEIARHGRRSRLPAERRARLWQLFESARGDLAARNLATPAQMFHALARHFREGAPAPYDFVLVDEAQDVSAPELAFLGALAGDRPNGLFFAGDIGQRIFRPAYSWKSAGVEIRGRSRSLRVNYRTSHRIRRLSDLLLPGTITEADGGEDIRDGVVSVFDGPAPERHECTDMAQEADIVAAWIERMIGQDVAPQEIGVLVRSIDQYERAREAIGMAGQTTHELTGVAAELVGQVGLATMHMAKGLEFRAVAVMACDADVIPSERRMTSASDPTDLEEIFATERHLLYVACTRAREHLLVSGVAPESEFLEDLHGN